MQSNLGGGSHRAGGAPVAVRTHVLIEDESKAERRRRKDAERLLETRQLDPWERYRALSDHVDHLLDVTELADRKTRFALVILGALNAVNVLIAIRAPQLGAESRESRSSCSRTSPATSCSRCMPPSSRSSRCGRGRRRWTARPRSVSRPA